MGMETSEWYNTQILVGFTGKLGFAWHYKKHLQGLESNHYEGAIPVEDVIRRLFSWQAEEAPIFVQLSGEQKLIADRKAIVRSDNGDVLGVFKDSYKPHQFDKWLLEDTANMLDDNLQIGSAGLLKGGAIAWVSIESPESVTVLEGFDVRPKLLATTSHNGSIATTHKLVQTFVVCDNTHMTAMSEDTPTFRTRHSKNSESRISRAREALGILQSSTANVVAEVTALANTKVSDAEWNAIINRIVPIGAEGEVRQQSISKAENKQEQLRWLYKNDERVSQWAGSLLGVSQAFSTYAQHVSGKDSNRVERNMMNMVTGKVETAHAEVMRIAKDLVLA